MVPPKRKMDVSHLELKTPPKKPKLGESLSSEFKEDEFVAIPGKLFLQL